MTTPRKKKLVKSRLQLRMTAVFLAVACSASMFQVVLLNWSLLRFSEQFGVQTELLLEGLPKLLLTNLVLSLVVLVPAMLYFGIQVTHRIAGPIYSFERHLDQIIAGERPNPVQLRDTDELQELCEKLNRAVDALATQGQGATSTGASEFGSGESSHRAA